jgi:hypothetical protein
MLNTSSFLCVSLQHVPVQGDDSTRLSAIRGEDLAAIHQDALRHTLVCSSARVTEFPCQVGGLGCLICDTWHLGVVCYLPAALRVLLQLAVLWGEVLRAGEAVEEVKLGFDTLVKLANIVPKISLKDTGLTNTPPSPTSNHHPTLSLHPGSISSTQPLACVSLPLPKSSDWLCRLHLAKFEPAVLGLLLASRYAVNHNTPYTTAHIRSVLQLN